MNHLNSFNGTLYVQMMDQHLRDCGIFFPGEAVKLFGRASIPSESELRKPETSPRDLNFEECNHSVAFILNSAAVLEQNENLGRSNILQGVLVLFKVTLYQTELVHLLAMQQEGLLWQSKCQGPELCTHRACRAQREGCFPGVNTYSLNIRLHFCAQGWQGSIRVSHSLGPWSFPSVD